jgi:RNA-binding protein 25
MVKYLGELEDEDVVMYVIEHLKDHKSPAKLVEGLEPVRIIHTSQTCA